MKDNYYPVTVGVAYSDTDSEKTPNDTDSQFFTIVFVLSFYPVLPDLF